MIISSYCAAQTKELSSSYMAVKKEEIHFENLSFDEIKAKAKKENKLIFINVYSVSCMPCKKMEKEVFTDPGVANYYNPNFINASYDYNGTQGSLVSEAYQINCFPNYLFMDGDGKIVHRSTGAMSQEEFLKLAATASNPKQRLLYYEEEYSKNKSNPEFLINYLRILDRVNCMPITLNFSLGSELESIAKRDTLLKEYFALQTEEMLSSRANWTAIRDFTHDYRSREFSYLLKNAAVFKKLYSEDSVNSKIKDVLISGGNLFGGNKPSSEVNEIAYINEIKKLNTQEAEPALFWLNLNSAEANLKWLDYMRLVMESGDKYILSSEENERVAKVIYENIEDMTALQKAEQMMKASADKEPSWLVYETYANVLYKLNKKKEAKSIALKALDAAKRIGAKPKNYAGITYLLEKIEKLPAQ